ncbi:MAG: nitroreductase family protein [Anaerolineales bacterium]
MPVIIYATMDSQKKWHYRLPPIDLKNFGSNIFSALAHLKRRLQFTGWLQYLIPAVVLLVIFLAAALAGTFGRVYQAVPLWMLGILLLGVEIFDLVTVKFRLRPHEQLPQRHDNLGMFDLIRLRRSCRSFQTRKLTAADYNELITSVRLHCAEPTIGTAPIRFEYVSAPLTVWPVVNATEFLVAIAPSKYDRLAVIDVGRTLEKIVIDATRMGLGTCWIGPGADHASIIRDLGARFNPEQDHIICVCAVGYRSSFWPILVRLIQIQFHRRKPLAELFFADAHFQQPLNVDAAPFNRFERCYEVCQWSPSSYNGQTTRCAAVMAPNGDQAGQDDEGQPHLERFDFYTATASRYYAPVAVGIWCAHWELGCEKLGIPGHFAVLPAEERGLKAEDAVQQLPRYDVSWVLDEKFEL